MTNRMVLAVQAFDFDRVFGPEVQQAGIFQDVWQLVTSALDGYNVCIFAYGQTGELTSTTLSHWGHANQPSQSERAAPLLTVLGREFAAAHMFGWFQVHEFLTPCE